MAFQENLNASIYMFSFSRSNLSDVSHGSGAVQGSFRATLGVASVFVMSTRMGSFEKSPSTHPPPLPTTLRFFSSYLDFSGGIFDL